MEDYLEIEGKTIEEAIKKAVKRWKLPKEKLKIKVLREPHQGLFGLKGEKTALIRVEKI